MEFYVTCIKKHGFTFPQYIYLQESDHRQDYHVKNAFDFDYSVDSYWISNTKSGYFSVCFPFHAITIESFEITTSSGSCRPKHVAAEVSNDGEHYRGYQSYNEAMTSKEKKRYFFNENSSYVRCFKFHTFESTCPQYTFGADVDQVEFFGNLIEINQMIDAFGNPKGKCSTCYSYYRKPLELFVIFLNQ